jgi:methylenetetrahydrofolate reductase (NADPH)
MSRDEAFELGCQWAKLYPEGSPSRAIINDFMNGSYLVNIVANDFKDGLTIFEPFLLDQSIASSAAETVINGVKAAVNGTSTTAVGESVVNGLKDGINGITEGVKKVLNGDLTNGHSNGVATNGH